MYTNIEYSYLIHELRKKIEKSLINNVFFSF